MSARHIPHVTAELPPGWSSVEAAELFGPAGLQMKITAQPVAPDMDTHGLAERHGAMLTEQVTGFRDHGVEATIAFGGNQALRRHTSFGGDMGPCRGIAAYLVHSGSAYVASATGPADAFSVHEPEVLAIIEDLLILGRPLVTLEPDGAVSEAEVPAGTCRRPALPGAAWQQVRGVWATPTEPAGAVEPTGPALMLTAEELLVVASVLGCGTFPTVDPLTLGALRRGERDATARAIARSLVVRGVLAESREGLCAAPDWGSLLEVALYPDLHVEVAVTSDGEPELTVLCVRPDALVQTTPHGPFGRRVVARRPEDLVQLIMAHSGPATAVARPGDGGPWAVDDLVETVKVRTTWRDGSALVGGELRWVVDTEGRLGAIDGTPEVGATSVVVRPTDLAGVRHEILVHLPGG